MKRIYQIPALESVQIEFLGMVMTSPETPITEPTSENDPNWAPKKRIF